MAKRKRKPEGKKKKPLTRDQKIAIAVLVWDLIKWLFDKMSK